MTEIRIHQLNWIPLHHLSLFPIPIGKQSRRREKRRRKKSHHNFQETHFKFIAIESVIIKNFHFFWVKKRRKAPIIRSISLHSISGCECLALYIIKTCYQNIRALNHTHYWHRENPSQIHHYSASIYERRLKRNENDRECVEPSTVSRYLLNRGLFPLKRLVGS